MYKKFKEVFGKSGDIIREYPMVLAMAFLAAISTISYISYDYNSQDQSFVYLKFAWVASLGISVMFAIKMLSQRIGKEIILQLFGLVFLVFFYFLLPLKEKEFTEVYAFLLIPTFILSHLLVSFIAFVRKDQELNFWQFNKNLFINIFLTAVFTGVLTGGIMLAILAVDQLFDFNFKGRCYSYTFSFLSIFGSSFIFLLFNEKGLSYLEKNGDYPVILKFFTQFILVPLLLIYAVILYFYSAKILINWELPRGWVSYLILAYSVVGILAILLVHPLKGDSTKSWVRIFSNVFYYTLAPLIILLFVAIFTRILEYGYTEPRYFVLIIALWLTTVVLYFIFIRRQTIKFVPVSLFVFGLFSLTFPYINAFSVAKRSQKSELVKSLSDHNLLENGTINFNKEIPNAVANDISDKFSFLAKRKEKDFLINFLATDVKKRYEKDLEDDQLWRYTSLRSEFKKIIYVDNKGKGNYLSTILTSKSSGIDISAYRQLFKVDYNNTRFEFENNKFELEIPGAVMKTEFNVVFNGQKINLLPEFKELFNNAPNDGEQGVENLFIIKKVGSYEIKVLFDSVLRNTSPKKDDTYIINEPSIIILIK